MSKLGHCCSLWRCLGVRLRPTGSDQPSTRPMRTKRLKSEISYNTTFKRHLRIAASNGASQTVNPGIVVVGTTGPLRSIADKSRDGFYAAYLKAAEQWHPGIPATMSHEEFEEKLAGWASLQISGIPGIASIRLRMLVPEGVMHDTQFASMAGSFLFGTTGDLVVARSDGDGLLWLDRVLCRDDQSYSTCAKEYQKGVFDQNTGQVLDRDRKPKPHGATLDLVSYKVIPES